MVFPPLAIMTPMLEPPDCCQPNQNLIVIVPFIPGHELPCIPIQDPPQCDRYTIQKDDSKDPGPEGPALIIPGGDLVYRHLTIYGVLEYWSDGVME